jgi:RimJ/RimL family protein N-acetyltransferase
MDIVETPRLTLRQLHGGDAAFILELLNDPTWLRFIGDRDIRNLDDAHAYIQNGPAASYAKHGFGLWLVQRKADDVPVGICGLLKRDTLEDVDVGFAFLQRFQGQGYGFESAAATLEYGRDHLGLKRIVAVTQPANDGSIRVLEKLGLRYEKMVQLSPTAPAIKLFAINL